MRMEEMFIECAGHGSGATNNFDQDFIKSDQPWDTDPLFRCLWGNDIWLQRVARFFSADVSERRFRELQLDALRVNMFRRDC